jgi:hypothetical protein
MTESPACRSTEIMSRRARRRQDVRRALVNPRIAAASCGSAPASARPSPLRRPQGSMERPARGGRHPLAGPEGSRPGLRLQPGPPGHTCSRRLVTSLTRGSGLSGGLASTAAHTQDRPVRPGPAGSSPRHKKGPLRCAGPPNRCSWPAGAQNRRCRAPLPQPPIRPPYVRNHRDTAPRDGT